MNKKYGWKPDLPDVRDHLYVSSLRTGTNVLPPSVDLRSQCSSVVDQGQLGSCTANAIANAHMFDQMKQKSPKLFYPSRLFIYYNERVIEGTVKEDSGAMIRDGIKSIADKGVCSETRLPYNISKFAKKPTKACYTEGLKHQAISYQRVSQVLSEMKGCLASGYPFVFGFTVYESFESQEVANTGIVPMPLNTEKVLGGHAVMAVGYDDSTQRFLVMNSWGTGWGMGGYFTIPYDYLTNSNLSDDFWTVKLVEN